MPDKTTKSILRGVVRSSIADPKFRKKLMANPKKTVEAAAGETFAEGVKVAVSDGATATLSITAPKAKAVKLTLPAAGHVVVDQLSDDELDRISGIASAATIYQTMWSGRR